MCLEDSGSCYQIFEVCYRNSIIRGILSSIFILQGSSYMVGLHYLPDAKSGTDRWQLLQPNAIPIVVMCLLVLFLKPCQVIFPHLPLLSHYVLAIVADWYDWKNIELKVRRLDLSSSGPVTHPSAALALLYIFSGLDYSSENEGMDQLILRPHLASKI